MPGRAAEAGADRAVGFRVMEVGVPAVAAVVDSLIAPFEACSVGSARGFNRFMHRMVLLADRVEVTTHRAAASEVAVAMAVAADF